tara:strand:- start:10709 stop:12385 length:1677 start_codon:yes stop_codon:yes gene_type:complete
MRLIRLTTTNEDAIFDNNFNSDIIIPKNAKIGLHSITFQKQDRTILITNINSRIFFKLNNTLGELVRFDLPFGDVYSSNNYTALFSKLQQGFNKAVQDGGNLGVNRDEFSVGKQWRVTIDNRAKINTEVRTGGSNFMSIQWTIPSDSNITVSGVQGDKNRLISSSGAPDPVKLNKNIIYNGEQSWGKGLATYSITIERFLINNLGAGLNGFVMGFTTKKPSEWTGNNGEIADKDIIYAIRNITGDNALGNYERKRRAMEPDGVTPTTWEDTGILPKRVDTGSVATNDTIYWEIHNNKIAVYLQWVDEGTGRIFTQYLMGSSGGGDAIIDYLSPNDVNLYPFLVCRGKSDTFGIRDVYINLDPFQVGKDGKFTTDEFINYPDTIYHQYFSNNTGAETHTHRHTDFATNLNTKYDDVLSLTYTNQLADFLGYKQIQPMSSFDDNEGGDGEVTGFNFISKFSFDSSLLMNAYLFELMSGLTLETYDGLTNNRRNMLAVIPERMLNQMIYYEPNNVNFINIKNDGTRVIRNLVARILDSELRPIKITGMAQATILIYDVDTE